MGKKVTVWFDERDLQATSFLYKTHRDWIQARFKDVGVEVTHFENQYHSDGSIKFQGLLVGRGDSDIDKRISMTVELGVNAREIHAE